MKVSKSLTAMILFVILCFSAFSFAAFATVEDDLSDPIEPSNEETAPITDETVPPATDPEPASSEPPVTEPSSQQQEEPQTEYRPPETEAPNYEPEPTYDYGENSVTDEPDYIPEDDNTASTDVDPIEVPKKTDIDDTLTDDDWAKIRLSLAENGGGDDDGDNFDFIQKNTGTANNGKWIKIVSIALLCGSVISLIAFIMLSKSASALKKKIHGGVKRSVFYSPEDDEYGDSYSSNNSRRGYDSKSRSRSSSRSSSNNRRNTGNDYNRRH